MATAGISDAVVRFIGEHIDSVEQLEVLLLLRREAERSFSAQVVGRELRIAEDSAAERLGDLASRGLLAKDAKAPPEFRYAPRSIGMEDAVSRLSTVYAERRVSVINLIFSKPSDKIRSFADAFQVVRRN